MRDRCLFLVDVGGIAQEKSEKRNKVARGYDVMGRDWEKKDGRELREVKEGLEGGTRWASGGGCPVYVWVWRGIDLGCWSWRSADVAGHFFPATVASVASGSGL